MSEFALNRYEIEIRQKLVHAMICDREYYCAEKLVSDAKILTDFILGREPLPSLTASQLSAMEKATTSVVARAA